MPSGPPSSVRRAFGVTGPAHPLAGGQQTVWHVGHLVLKRVAPGEVVAWQADVLRAVGPEDGVRVAPPVRSRSGEWVVDGWAGWRYVEGRSAGSDWLAIVEAGRRFHAALRHPPPPEFLSGRDDVWARADRLVWDLEATAPHPVLAPAFAARRLLALPEQLVHGDLTRNVLVDATAGPAVIDFSPYWRPRAWASAIVVADALLLGETDDLVDAVAEGESVSPAEFAQVVLRAVLFRLTTDVLAGETELDSGALRALDLAMRRASL